MNALAVGSGSLIGLGLLIVIAQLTPAPPRLSEALVRLEGGELEWSTRRGLASQLTRLGLPVPHRDLDLVGMGAETFMLKRIGYLVLGLAVPAVLNAMVALTTGTSMPWLVPAGIGVALGVVFGLTPDIAVRRQAAELRREFRAALSTYLDLVALERAAGAGPSEALHAPADVCTGWVFVRINAVLLQARRSGEQPWRSLADLGERVGVAELTELADIAEDAGTVGAQVMPTLLAKAQSMRTAALTDARAQANSRTSEMPVAIAMSIGGFLLLVTFPAVYRLFVS